LRISPRGYPCGLMSFRGGSRTLYSLQSPETQTKTPPCGVRKRGPCSGPKTWCWTRVRRRIR